MTLPGIPKKYKIIKHKTTKLEAIEQPLCVLLQFLGGQMSFARLDLDGLVFLVFSTPLWLLHSFCLLFCAVPCTLGEGI